MPDLPSFRYRLEEQEHADRPGWHHGELNRHANAAEWAYVISGSCRTTILHPPVAIHPASGETRSNGV
jgi:hypothetical protein